jgi:outer membrane protein OmpA-like peptidoglycan-associated protein
MPAGGTGAWRPRAGVSLRFTEEGWNMRSRQTRNWPLALIVLVLPAIPAYGQGWLDAVKQKATEIAAEELDKATEKDADTVKCVSTDQACVDQAQAEGKKVVLTNKKGKPLPPEQQPAPSNTVAAPATAVGTAVPAAAGGQPNLSAVKSDFVPGEKTLFLDDFTDMAGDEPPPHWKVRGGMVELRKGEGIRQLTITNTAVELTPNLKALPQNFTMEAELTLENLTGNGGSVRWYFMNKDGYQLIELKLFAQASDEGFSVSTDLLTGDPTRDIESIGTARPAIDWRKPMQQALWLQDGRIRVYMNGVRVIDVNQVDVDMARVAYVKFALDMNNSPEAVVGLRRVRFAESAPDFSKVIVASGRYVTHGILFDTDSDRIKPESAAVIKSIARGLETNPNLRLLIEGHTDSTGDAAHNMDLSRRRAEAVRTVLVSQFNVDAARLTTAGLGASKPIASNDTPQGRADNRRVELVKQ